MILGFKPYFVPLILNGTKIHTIREDRGNRWEPGKIIHMATGMRTKSYNQFKKELCVSTQNIHIDPFTEIVSIDGNKLHRSQIHELSINDGFYYIGYFFAFFNKNFTGRIIHWTNKRY